MKQLLELLTVHGGKIVCTASMTPEFIRQAQASGRMFVDENSIGFVWEPPIYKLPETEAEVEFFEKWYPLPVQIPEKLKTLDWLYEAQENCGGAKCQVKKCLICKNEQY